MAALRIRVGLSLLALSGADAQTLVKEGTETSAGFFLGREQVTTLTDAEADGVILSATGDGEAAWLAKGLTYWQKTSASDQDYLFGRKSPESTFGSWAMTLIDAMESLTRTGVEVDDHDGTPIGEGETIGLAAAYLQMYPTQIAKLPAAFQSGLFAPCASNGCNKLPAALRISTTKAAGNDLLRIAMDVDLGGQSATLTTTETLKAFPMADSSVLEAFIYSVKWGNAWAAAKHPISMGKLVAATLSLNHVYGSEVKKGGAMSKVYYSMTPYLIGSPSSTPGAMKYRLVPKFDSSFPGPARADYKNGMRLDFVNWLYKLNVTYYLEIQVATDPSQQPLNDASYVWDEATAPWVRMGEVVMPKQKFPFSTPAQQPVPTGDAVAEGLWEGNPPKMAFNSKELLFKPGDTPHTPLGDINAFRAYAYSRYDKARQEHLLRKAGGAPAKCPFSQIHNFVR